MLGEARTMHRSSRFELASSDFVWASHRQCTRSVSLSLSLSLSVVMMMVVVVVVVAAAVVRALGALLLCLLRTITWYTLVSSISHLSTYP